MSSLMAEFLSLYQKATPGDFIVDADRYAVVVEKSQPERTVGVFSCGDGAMNNALFLVAAQRLAKQLLEPTVNRFKAFLGAGEYVHRRKVAEDLLFLYGVKRFGELGTSDQEEFLSIVEDPEVLTFTDQRARRRWMMVKMLEKPE